jgi:membrane peptidoglycan carboxypeptidase
MIYTIKYESGRKDAVLNRMYEDGYIDQTQLTQAFMEGLTLTLQSEKISLQAPHFVFWVKDLLRKDPTLQALNITDEMLYQG